VNGWDTSACQGLLEDAAVALLTRQPIPEQVLAHAATCPPCRDEIAAMTQLPGRLALAADGGLVEPVEPSPLLLPRLLAEVDRRRARRRWTTVAVAAAAAAVAVGTTVGLDLRSAEHRAPVAAAGQGGPSASGPAGTTPGSLSTGSASAGTANAGTASAGPSNAGTASAPSTGLSVSEPPTVGTVVASAEGLDRVTGASAEVSVLAGDWGSQVQVEVYNVPPRTECRLVVIDRHGKRVEAGSWVVPAGGYSERGQGFTETVATRPADIVAVAIIDNKTDRQMMQMKVRHA